MRHNRPPARRPATQLERFVPKVARYLGLSKNDPKFVKWQIPNIRLMLVIHKVLSIMRKRFFFHRKVFGVFGSAAYVAWHGTMRFMCLHLLVRRELLWRKYIMKKMHDQYKYINTVKVSNST